MRTLGMMVAEAMLNEKTSDIRRFKQMGKNPPEWAKDFAKGESTSSTWRLAENGLKELAKAYGWNERIWYTSSVRDILDDMFKKYLNEFIDDEDVPTNVGCWMLEDILKNQTKKIKETDIIKLANYLNNEIHWVMPK